MSRIVAVVWHALFSILAGVAYFFFVLPRWWELSGDWSHTLGTVMRIVAGALIGLAALPVVFTWLRTRRPEYGTPPLALRLRLCSIVLHALAGVLIIGTAISEIWFTLDDAGRWLFGIYGAAASSSGLRESNDTMGPFAVEGRGFGVTRGPEQVGIASAAEPGAAGRHSSSLGDPAHPTEPIDPCCLPALGEFTG